MVTALTYLMVLISLSVLLRLVGNERHESRDDSDEFRYPSVLLWVLLAGPPVCGLMGLFVYSTFPPPRPTGNELYIFVTIFALAIAGSSYAYLYFKKYSILITKEVIVIGGLWRKRTVHFHDIRKVNITEGARGSMQLTLLADRDQTILKVYSTIQDFMGLVELLKMRTRNNGVMLRERDKWGEWSERINGDQR